MIIGIGLDIADILEIERTIKKYGKRFLNRIFTEQEQNYSHNKAAKFQHYAARFAVKESVIKALGCIEENKTIPLKEISVNNDKNGKPFVKLTATAQKLFKKSGAKKCHISISHTKTIASAVAILEK